MLQYSGNIIEWSGVSIKEIWKDIPGYENLYQASNLGKIKRLKSNVWNRFKYVVKEEHILKPRHNKKGYVSYALFKNNVREDFKGHWLILHTFKGYSNDAEKNQINHINGIKDDNRLENLEWCSASYNMKHAYEIGLHKPKRGGNNGHAKKVEQLDINGNYIRTFDCLADAKRIYGKNIHITECCKGKRKFAGGYKWRYVNE